MTRILPFCGEVLTSLLLSPLLLPLISDLLESLFSVPLPFLRFPLPAYFPFLLEKGILPEEVLPSPPFYPFFLPVLSAAQLAPDEEMSLFPLLLEFFFALG